MLIVPEVNTMHINNVRSATDTGFTAHLSKLLIDDPELEIVVYHMFIESDDKSRSLWRILYIYFIHI